MLQPQEGTTVVRPAGRPLTTLPGPHGLPLVGHLWQLKATQLHTILEQWADTYGPLYTFRLGRKPVLAVADPTLIYPDRAPLPARALSAVGHHGRCPGRHRGPRPVYGGRRAMAPPAPRGDAGLDPPAAPPVLADP